MRWIVTKTKATPSQRIQRQSHIPSNHARKTIFRLSHLFPHSTPPSSSSSFSLLYLPLPLHPHTLLPTNSPAKTMGCAPSRPTPTSFHHSPKYPQVPPGQTPQDCTTCTHVNRKFQQRCGAGCTATRRSNLRSKWNPGVHPVRHSCRYFFLNFFWWEAPFPGFHFYGRFKIDGADDNGA